MKQRRWLKSIIAASTEAQVALPFQRGNRRRPAALQSAPAKPASTTATRPGAIAAN